MAGMARAMIMGPALSLEALGQKADLVVKARAVSDKVVQDAAFPNFPGYEVKETTLQVLASFKGPLGPGDALRFRHYALKPGDIVYMSEPQHHELQTGQGYLVFARKGSDEAFATLWT